MSGRYFNDDGEPLMTAAQARLEDDLDSEPVEWSDAYDDNRYIGWD